MGRSKRPWEAEYGGLREWVPSRSEVDELRRQYDRAMVDGEGYASSRDQWWSAKRRMKVLPSIIDYLEQKNLLWRFISEGIQVKISGKLIFQWWTTNDVIATTGKAGYQTIPRSRAAGVVEALKMVVEAAEARKRYAMSKSSGENYEPVEIEDCTVDRETEKAILVKVAEKYHWIPKSQISDDSEVYKADTDGTLIIPEWLAVEKGLV